MKLPASLLEKLDPRTKIISFLSVILCMIMTPITRIRDFGLYFLLILMIGFLSKLTPGQILKRVCILISFFLLIALFVAFIKEGEVCWTLKIIYWEFDITYEGILTSLTIVLKSALSLFLLVIAFSTTTFPEFLKGLDMLRLPRLPVLAMSFMYRSVSELIDRARRLTSAIPPRCNSDGHNKGYMIRELCIRTIERAGRIIGALLIREFSGEAMSDKRMKFSLIDILFMAGIIISLLCIVSGLINDIMQIRVSSTHLWQGL